MNPQPACKQRHHDFLLFCGTHISVIDEVRLRANVKSAPKRAPVSRNAEFPRLKATNPQHDILAL